MKEFQTITSKKSVKSGVKSMAAKAQTWSQVCKQLSGIGGYVEIGDGEKVRPIELMRSLNVFVTKNSYKPADIFAAWNERMKEGNQVLMSKGVPYMVVFNGYPYQLYKESTKEEGKYAGVTVKQLCPLVSACDKGVNTVTVNATNILRGLLQSLYVDDTLDAIEKSVKKCSSLNQGYINLAVGKKSPARWVRVEKKDGLWQVYVSQEERELAAKKAARQALIDSAVCDYDMGLITKEEYDARIKIA